MVDEGRGDQLVDESQVLLIQDLFNLSAHQSFVIC